jgi:hypothetical protein
MLSNLPQKVSKIFQTPFILLYSIPLWELDVASSNPVAPIGPFRNLKTKKAADLTSAALRIDRLAEARRARNVDYALRKRGGSPSPRASNAYTAFSMRLTAEIAKWARFARSHFLCAAYTSQEPAHSLPFFQL